VSGIGYRPAALDKTMAKITLYSTDWCGYCERARRLLDERGLAYEEIAIDEQPDFRARLLELTGGWTVPQIVIDGKPIGGYLELWRLDQEGELERLAA
jgi:glutaredoxin 3